MSDEDIASRMYGGGGSQSQSQPQPSQPPADDPSARMYGGEQKQTRGNPYTLERGTADALYGATDNVNVAEDADLDRLAEGGDADTLRSNLGFMAAEAGASADDVTGLVNAANEFVSAGKRVDPAQRQATLQEVTREHGQARLDDAIDLVSSYPQLADWLAKTGAGDDPRFVRKMIQLSKTPRGRARIQKFRGQNQ